MSRHRESRLSPARFTLGQLLMTILVIAGAGLVFVPRLPSSKPKTVVPYAPAHLQATQFDQRMRDWVRRYRFHVDVLGRDEAVFHRAFARGTKLTKARTYLTLWQLRTPDHGTGLYRPIQPAP